MPTRINSTPFGAYLRKQYALKGVFDDLTILNEIGLPSGTVENWVSNTQGVTPSRLSQVANATGLNKLDLMVLAGWLTVEEANRGTSPGIEDEL